MTSPRRVVPFRRLDTERTLPFRRGVWGPEEPTDTRRGPVEQDRASHVLAEQETHRPNDEAKPDRMVLWQGPETSGDTRDRGTRHEEAHLTRSPVPSGRPQDRPSYPRKTLDAACLTPRGSNTPLRNYRYGAGRWGGEKQCSCYQNVT